MPTRLAIIVTHPIQHFVPFYRALASDQEIDLHVLYGAPIGVQSIRAEDFGIARQVESGSWLGLAHHGKGIGTEMRAAVLDLAFAGLGAVQAVSTSFQDNPASQAVSRKLGYQPNGLFRRAAEGVARVDLSMVLSREGWERHRAVEVTVEGLQPCLAMFGVPEE